MQFRIELIIIITQERILHMLSIKLKNRRTLHAENYIQVYGRSEAAREAAIKWLISNVTSPVIPSKFDYNVQGKETVPAIALYAASSLTPVDSSGRASIQLLGIIYGVAEMYSDAVSAKDVILEALDVVNASGECMLRFQHPDFGCAYKLGK